MALMAVCVIKHVYLLHIDEFQALHKAGKASVKAEPILASLNLYYVSMLWPSFIFFLLHW